VSAHLRSAALALRDLLEATGADEGTLTFGGLIVTFNRDDGFHMLPADGRSVDITEWVEWTGLVPAEGVESVRDQFVSRAAVARADACS
jgi:hypothetical protein